MLFQSVWCLRNGSWRRSPLACPGFLRLRPTVFISDSSLLACAALPRFFFLPLLPNLLLFSCCCALAALSFGRLVLPLSLLGLLFLSSVGPSTFFLKDAYHLFLTSLSLASILAILHSDCLVCSDFYDYIFFLLRPRFLGQVGVQVVVPPSRHCFPMRPGKKSQCKTISSCHIFLQVVLVSHLPQASGSFSLNDTRV